MSSPISHSFPTNHSSTPPFSRLLELSVAVPVDHLRSMRTKKLEMILNGGTELGLIVWLSAVAALKYLGRWNRVLSRDRNGNKPMLCMVLYYFELASRINLMEKR